MSADPSHPHGDSREAQALQAAIFVPSLGRLVRGYESWWSAMRSPEDLRSITDQDIDNAWYVQALKSLSEGSSDSSGTS